MFNINQIHFRDHVFEGFKFASTSEFTEEYFDKLLEDGSPVSEEIYANAMDMDTLESIHIKLSYSLLLRLVGFILLLPCLILSVYRMPIAAGVCIFFSLIGIIASIRLNNRANEMYSLRGSTEALVRILFEEERKKTSNPKEGE